ncbi:UDP-N-acetylmuramoylalanyl-D-glutamate--2, 6-diaminopimelate ligase [Bacteroidia bacterium]|nr:UDP-N-acetylmuramoylalanyl-D-glutamate--2, 6-diaminopimelate ligase [Bacteroidia bacterium]
MKINNILIPLCLLAFVSSCRQSAFRSGDFLFQDIDCPLCTAIESVTDGYEGYNFSHVGMLVEANGSWYVLEAIGDKVVQTPLPEFMDRSKDADGNPKVLQMRLNEQYRKIVPAIVDAVKSHLGKPYDDEFLPDNGKYYCSELLYDAVQQVTKDTAIFRLQPMCYINPLTGTTNFLWLDYFRQLGASVPEGVAGVNPGLMSRSEALTFMQVFGKISKKNKYQVYGRQICGFTIAPL